MEFITKPVPPTPPPSGADEGSTQRHHFCGHHGCRELVPADKEYCQLHDEKVYRCAGVDENGRLCRKVVAKAGEYCYRHDPERQRRRAERRVGTHGGARNKKAGVPADDSAKNAKKKRDKSDADRDLRNAMKGTGSGGGGGNPVTNPNSKKARKKRRKEEQRRKK